MTIVYLLFLAVCLAIFIFGFGHLLRFLVYMAKGVHMTLGAVLYVIFVGSFLCVLGLFGVLYYYPLAFASYINL